jgi:hypothetical protein
MRRMTAAAVGEGGENLLPLQLQMMARNIVTGVTWQAFGNA